MLFSSAVRKLENNRTMVMYRRGSDKYVHLTVGIQLSKEQTDTLLSTDTRAKKLSYMMVIIDDDLIIPYAPSFDDVLATDWQVKYREVSDNLDVNAGIVRLQKEMVKQAIEIVEGWGYGEYVSQFNNSDGTVMVTFDSYLFKAPKSGEPTPEYFLTVDQVNETIRAELVTK